MPKKVSVVAPKTPRDISMSFIMDYFKTGLAEKSITKKAYKEWLAAVKEIESQTFKTKMDRTRAIKKEFIKRYYPQFDKDNKDTSLSSMFEALL